MSGLSISDLPWPKEANRIDLHSLGFETEQFSDREDATRAKCARAKAAKHGGEWGDQANRLADLLDPKLISELPVSLASSRYFRDQRIRVGSDLFRLLKENEVDRNSLVRADIIKPKWACDVYGLQDLDPARLTSEFRADILRVAAANTKNGSCGRSAKRKGFLIAAIHGEFDPLAKLYQPHLHLAATQDYVGMVDQLRGLEGYKRTDRVRRPVRITRKIFDLPGAITYLLKAYWPQRPFLPLGSEGAPKRPRSGQRIDEPFHTEVLMWLDRWNISELVLLMGLRVGKNGLVATHG